jgi:hypothetical protein
MQLGFHPVAVPCSLPHPITDPYSEQDKSSTQIFVLLIYWQFEYYQSIDP